MAFDWYDEKGKENYPRVFFALSYHTDTIEEHHVLTSELETYDWNQWSPWINDGKIMLPKRAIKIDDDKYGILLSNDLPEL